MKSNSISKLALVALVTVMLGAFPLACKKGEAPEPKVEAEEVDEHAEHDHAKQETEKKEEPKATEEKSEKSEEQDGEKVDSVKGAFQYTGKEIDKGLKKTGSSTKKFFVGDDKKK